ncbi:MAG: tyrosine--tRNA ligase [Planctomycetota bacterium]
MENDLNKQLAVIKRGAETVVTEEELKRKLAKSLETGKPLRVKLGIDPTGKDLTLGHAVPLRKLRQFQDLGHQAVLIIGDYTARVGDPTGREKTRPDLSPEAIEANAQGYLAQAGKILDLPRVEVVRNGDWFAKLPFADVVKLASKMTVARILERDDFSRRYKGGIPIGLHEFLYPLMQGYDSVMVRADIELGATEQTFNLLVGRELQRDAGQAPQVALALPILVGTDGVEKMGKSLGNYIGISESPREIFGKVMSIPDSAIRTYFALCTEVSEADVAAILAEGRNPRDAKDKLGQEIVALYHGREAGAAASEEFRRVFREKALPEAIPEVKIPPAEIQDGKVWLPKLLVLAGIASGTSAARRDIEGGGVRLDGEKVTDPKVEVVVKDGMLLQVGKRKFARIRVS